MNNLYKRGEIYYIRDTRQVVGSEQKSNRPAVIVSNNKNNEHSGVIEVVYMTTQPKTDMPTHFVTHSALKPSTVLCEQISSVYIDRIGEWVGTLTDDEMKALDYCIVISVGLANESGIVEPISEDLLNSKEKQIEKLKKQVAETKEAQAASERKATIYKEMYDFLLEKRLEA